MDCHFEGILAKISRLGAFYSLYPGPFTKSAGRGLGWVAFGKNGLSDYPNIHYTGSIGVSLLKGSEVLNKCWLKKYDIGKIAYSVGLCAEV